MSVSSTNNSLEQINSSYQSNEPDKNEKEEALGRDTFLTMLVAQLENQDPLNPMDGTDFSAQLAQFSQLEQLINLNDSMETLASSFTASTDGDVIGYIGRQVTGTVDVMNVDQGAVSGGFYNLGQPSDIMITVTDADGKVIKTLYEGQQSAGSHLISWDGTDNNSEAVKDGTYKYSVMANTGSGFSEIPSSVTGNVEGVTYNNGRPYLVVQGVLLDPSSLTSVVDVENNNGSDSTDSIMSYLGRTVSSNSPIVQVEDGAVSGGDLTVQMESEKDVTLKIYDAYDELIRTITVSKDDTSSGVNKINWDGMADSGYKAADGIYYYTAKTDEGFLKTSVTEEVSGIKSMNNTQYLVLNESGRLVALSTITEISD